MALVDLLDRWWLVIGPVVLLLALLAVLVAVGLWLWRRVIRPVAVLLRRTFEAESVAGRPEPSWATVLSPRGMARLLYVPRNVYQVDNPLVARASLFRSLCGVLLWAALAVNYDLPALVRQIGALGDQINNAALLSAIVVVGAAALVVLRVPAADRWVALRAFGRPLLTIAATAALVLFLYVAGFIFFTLDAAEQATRNQAEYGTWVTLAQGLFGFWLTFFILFAVYYNARHLFNAADAHPVLVPLGTTIVTWLLAIAGMLQAAGTQVPMLASNYASPIPTSVAIPLSLGGAVLVTGLAGWEYQLLRKDSYHLLKGPWR